jgi:ABC-type nitrate/sulfonate/bicarbonate transport system substrate-binding protein
MSRRDNSEEEKITTMDGEEEMVNELDEVLPGGVDRRRFLRGTLGAVGAAMFAGCSGDDDGNGDDAFDDEEVVFTSPWKQEPSWGGVHVADQKDYWEDAGVPDIEGQEGSGSDTESQNVGVGNKVFGVTSVTTALSVWDGGEDVDALNMSLVEIAKTKPNLSLIWRTDEVDNKNDLSGKSVYLASGFAAATQDMVPALTDVDADDIEFTEGGEEAGPSLLENNNVQAVWGAIDLLPAYRDQLDIEIDGVSLSNSDWGTFFGFGLWASNEWYEGKDNAEGFTARAIEGYNKALKWILLNREDFLNFMKNEVNTNLKTWTDEELNGQFDVMAAQIVTEDNADEGLGYYDTQDLQTHIDTAGSALLDDPSVLPSADEMALTGPWEQSEKVTFSDDEFDTVKEEAGDFWDLLRA